MATLIVLRGNSGSGKTTIAKHLQKEVFGYETAVIEQDYIRRELLREKDRPNQPNIELINMVVRFSMKHKAVVILEGILPKKHYGDILLELANDFESTRFYYFELSFEETLRRHATKPNKDEFGEKEMREWFQAGDMMNLASEKVITAGMSRNEIIQLIKNANTPSR